MGRKRHTFRQVKHGLKTEDRCNDLLIQFYKNQESIIPKEDWETFITSLKSELPSTFRVTGFRKQSLELFWLLRNRFLDNLTNHERPTELALPVDSNIPQSEKEGEITISQSVVCEPIIVRPEPLLWYPNGMAWQLNASRVQIRRSNELKRLHQFLISETESGYISRQEAVSMIPPLLMDIESHHKVLDICAAPGSKTAQLVEMIHSSHVAKGDKGDPSGFVVANDVDGKRCYMMIHQVSRLQSPCVVITRHDATNFPKFYLPDENKEGATKQLLFDRILADVPCSGDGTLRKNPDLWTRWSPNLGLAEHFLQSKILRRSLELLAIGGKMIYSTCSMNPVEDEAVIANILGQCDSQVRVVDVSHKLPHLKFLPGITSWRIMLKTGVWCSSVDEVPENQLRAVRPSLFPPSNAADLGLTNCMRILPHYQNTGGFFVAVLEKTGPLPWMKKPKEVNEEDSKVTDENGTNWTESTPIDKAELTEGDAPSIDSGDQAAKDGSKGPVMARSEEPPRKKQRVFREEPFFFMTETDPELSRLRDYYGLCESFPVTQLMFRSAQGKRRNLYFSNKSVRDLVLCNSDRDINFINLGVRLFGISDDKHYSGYRLLQDGVEIADSVVSEKRRIHISRRTDVMTLLEYDMPLITSFCEKTMKRFHQLETGPVLFEYTPSISAENPEEMPRLRLVFAGWRGKASLRHYVNDHERQHLLRLCGIIDPGKVKSAMSRRTSPSPTATVEDNSITE